MSKIKKALTPADIEDLKAVFATKDDIKSLRNDIVNFKDDILHEVVAIR